MTEINLKPDADYARELLAKTRSDIAEMEAECHEDIVRYDDEFRERRNRRMALFHAEVAPLHKLRLSLTDALSDLEMLKPLKLTVTKEWCLNMAKLEGDGEIGAGAVARDPE